MQVLEEAKEAMGRWGGDFILGWGRVGREVGEGRENRGKNPRFFDFSRGFRYCAFMHTFLVVGLWP